MDEIDKAIEEAGKKQLSCEHKNVTPGQTPGNYKCLDCGLMLWSQNSEQYKHHFYIFGHEMLEKTAKPFGQNGAHIIVPTGWIGSRIAIVRLDEGQD